MKNVKKNVTIDFSLYFNEETGESLASELVSKESKTMVSVKEDTGLVTLEKSKEFAYINFETLRKLNDVLSVTDRGYMLQMFELTKTEMNILYNHTQPHTNATLQSFLKFKSKGKFFDLIKRLMKAGVLYQMKGSINGAVRVVYILNPKISNRRRTFSVEIFGLFKDFD